MEDGCRERAGEKVKDTGCGEHAREKTKHAGCRNCMGENTQHTGYMARERDKDKAEKICWQSGGLTAVFDRARAAWVSMRGADDPQQTEFLLMPEEFPAYDGEDARWLGNLSLCVEREKTGGSQNFVTSALWESRRLQEEADRIRVTYGASKKTCGLEITEEYVRSSQGIRWEITLENRAEDPLTVRRLGIPLLMNQYFRGDDTFKYEQCVLRHSCICHQNSWFYYAKSSMDMPLLMMKTMGQTALDCFDVEHEDPVWKDQGSFGEAFEGLYTVYPVHEKTEAFPGTDGPRRLEPGQTAGFAFLFSMQNSFEEAWNWLAQNGGFYLESVPGMAAPVGEELRVTIVSGQKPELAALEREDRAGKVRYAGAGRWEATVALGGFGRRSVAVRVGEALSRIEFWGLEPVEEIYRRQARFIVQNQRETNPEDPCWHGLLMWDMEQKHRINSSCNPYGPNWFAGGSDEIGLVSGLFLSEWNVYRPSEEQIRALRDYCVDFIGERLTEQPGYRVHRMVPWFRMVDDWKGRGADDVWRAFNYVHVLNTFYNMYRIAARYSYSWLEPKKFWLRRAYCYAAAMFSWWMFPNGEGADKYGNMGETVLATELADALRKEGMEQEAAQIDGLIWKKAAYFAGKKYPYGSEMAYDSTAYEAVYGYGKAIGDRRVMESSMRAALANRGRQPVWYLYMTDLRAGGDSRWNVSYMTQLGACTMQDWLMEERRYDPALAKAFYGSYLAGFSLYNSGGCYSDAPENRGASGWIISGESGRFTGRRQDPLMQGCVAMSGESALGYYGALRSACSVLFQEKERWTALGCSVALEPDGYRCIPRDGLRIRFLDMENGWAVKLERDALLEIRKDSEGITIVIENITGDAHHCPVLFRDDQNMEWESSVDGCEQEKAQAGESGKEERREKQKEETKGDGGWMRIEVPLSEGKNRELRLRRTKPEF